MERRGAGVIDAAGLARGEMGEDGLDARDLALVREDQARDVAAVERPAHRRESGQAVAAGRALL